MKIRFSLLLALMVISLCSVSSRAQTNDWLPSKSEENIETLYQIEKTGSKSYDVTIRVNNNRSKEITVRVAVLFTTSKKVEKWLKNKQDYDFENSCLVTVKPGESGECSVETTTNKIKGTDFKWNNGKTYKSNKRNASGL